MRQLAAASFVLLSACGGSEDFKSTPVDVSGTYSVSVTNRANDCNIQDWVEGKSGSGIDLTLSQSGSDISGTINGWVGLYVQLAIGSNSFSGKVDGSKVHATNFGTRQQSSGGCAYTINMVLDGELQQNALQGTISYKPQTNGSPDCGVLETCQNIQDFSGSRPPKS